MRFPSYLAVTLDQLTTTACGLDGVFAVESHADVYRLRLLVPR
jgi:uncharacterized protein VirK/YbjX